MNASCLLSGGGYDSLAVALWLHRNRLPFDLLHIDYGQVAAAAELKANHEIGRALNAPVFHIFSVLPFEHWRDPRERPALLGGANPSPEILGRNTHLVHLAASHYQKVYMGLDMPLAGKPFADCSEQWRDQVEGLMRLTYPRFEGVYAPYLTVPKALAFQEASDYARYLGLNFWELGMTCWFPRSDGTACGQCQHCLSATSLRKEIESGKD